MADCLPFARNDAVSVVELDIEWKRLHIRLAVSWYGFYAYVLKENFLINVSDSIKPLCNKNLPNMISAFLKSPSAATWFTHTSNPTFRRSIAIFSLDS